MPHNNPFDVTTSTCTVFATLRRSFDTYDGGKVGGYRLKTVRVELTRSADLATTAGLLEVVVRGRRNNDDGTPSRGVSDVQAPTHGLCDSCVRSLTIVYAIALRASQVNRQPAVVDAVSRQFADKLADAVKQRPSEDPDGAVLNASPYRLLTDMAARIYDTQENKH